MLSRDKIRLMTGLAIYEKHGGNEDLKIDRHYRYDYVMSQMFSAFIRYTLCFAAGLAVYILVSSNDLFLNINTYGFIITVKKYGIIYLAGLILYLAVTVAVAVVRYNRASENTRIYGAALKKLDRRFLSGRKR